MTEYGEVIENASLKDYTSLKVGGKCHFLIKPYSTNHLIKLLEYLKAKKYRYYILGKGTNVIIDDNYFDGVIIRLDNLNKIIYNDNIVTAQCGVSLPLFVKDTLKHGFTSLGFAAMIPGSIGGSVVGNAGAYGHEIMEYLKSLTVINQNNEVITIDKNDISFGYRYTSLKDKYIILDATFILNKGDVIQEENNIKANNQKRIDTQPLEYPNVGSIFRNPEGDSAGRIIESLNLKGKEIGGALISNKHANFIVNKKDATFKDVTSLINEIKKEVKEKKNINLIVEPTIITWRDI